LDGRESSFALRLDQRVKNYTQGRITSREYMDAQYAEDIGGVIGAGLLAWWYLAPEAPLLLVRSRLPTATAIATDLALGEIGATAGGAGLIYTNVTKSLPRVLPDVASNYRTRFLQSRPDLPKDYQVHHSIPQRYTEIFEAADVNL
jgi:hypothetical protein